MKRFLSAAFSLALVLFLTSSIAAAHSETLGGQGFIGKEIPAASAPAAESPAPTTSPAPSAAPSSTPAPDPTASPTLKPGGATVTLGGGVSPQTGDKTRIALPIFIAAFSIVIIFVLLYRRKRQRQNLDQKSE